jgi:hypothetical protein
MAADPFAGDVLKLVGEGNLWRRRGELPDIFRRQQGDSNCIHRRHYPAHFCDVLTTVPKWRPSCNPSGLTPTAL